MNIERNRLDTRGKTGSIVMVLLVALIGYVSYLFGEPYWIKLQMRKIAKDAILTYQVTGSQVSAQQKLESGMRKEHIPLYIDDRDCVYRESRSQFSVECIWVAPIIFPLPGKELDFSKQYRVYAAIDDGQVTER